MHWELKIHAVTIKNHYLLHLLNIEVKNKSYAISNTTKVLQ